MPSSINTFCRGGAWLTTLEIMTGDVWQAIEKKRYIGDDVEFAAIAQRTRRRYADKKDQASRTR